MLKKCKIKTSYDPDEYKGLHKTALSFLQLFFFPSSLLKLIYYFFTHLHLTMKSLSIMQVKSHVTKILLFSFQTLSSNGAFIFITAELLVCTFFFFFFSRPFYFFPLELSPLLQETYNLTLSYKQRRSTSQEALSRTRCTTIEVLKKSTIS